MFVRTTFNDIIPFWYMSIELCLKQEGCPSISVKVVLLHCALSGMYCPCCVVSAAGRPATPCSLSTCTLCCAVRALCSSNDSFPFWYAFESSFFEGKKRFSPFCERPTGDMLHFQTFPSHGFWDSVLLL
ncbi:hypothetical protein SESBI_15239 [Sesbania bispinosa]|nr:hypothetical protein SESBI_15239 [Sesbania bispinosa]